MLPYKGYTGSLEYSKEDNVFYGKILGVNALVLFEADKKDELEKSFHEAVDDYLETCEQIGIKPEKSCV